MDFALTFIAPAVLGFFVGVCSGMLGIGGGTIMVPAFRLLFGMSPLASTATSLFAIIPTSISGAITHIRFKTAIIPLGLVLGIGGACTSPLGVLLAGASPEWAIMVVAALVIGYSALNMLVKAARMKEPHIGEDASNVTLQAAGDSEVTSSPATAVASAGAENADVPVPTHTKLSRKQVVTGIVIGLGAGLISGYVGVGGGFIMVPLMVAFLGVSMKQASGTSLVAMIILAIPGTIQQGFLGNIDYMSGLIVAVGSIPGAVLGAYLIRFVRERTLRFIFGGFLIIAAILLVFNELSVLG